jgi:hypothetical protein
MPAARRILDQDHLTAIPGKLSNRQLRVEKLPWEQIRAARAARGGKP